MQIECLALVPSTLLTNFNNKEMLNMLKHMKYVKQAKNEILLMAILFSLFFIMLLYNEGAAVLSVSACLFNIIAKDLFSQRA